MFIQRYLRGRPFQPAAAAVLREALAKASEALGIAPDQQAKRELIAQLIIQAALDDQSLDASGLSRKAVAAFRKSTQR
jgi:hypothetical protein